MRRVSTSGCPTSAEDSYYRYSGCYPPPHGPRAWSATHLSHNTWSSASHHELNLATPSTDLTASIDALRAFHLARLLTYAEDDATWRAVDWIGFETVPLLREGLAIRQAMHELEETLSIRYGPASEPWWRKRFWVSFVFPSGKAPDGASPGQIARRMLGESKDGRRPNGLGINCTSPAYIGEIVQEMTRAAAAHSGEAAPAFVLYPDGGLVYDPVSKTWQAPASSGPASQATGLDPTSWAESVASVAQTAARSTAKHDGAQRAVWSEVIVGGCCKAGFAEIAALAKRVKAADARI